MCKLDLGKAEEPEIKLPASVGSSKKARDFQKDIYFCFIDYAKACDCVDHNKLWEILQEMGIQDYLSCLWALPGGSEVKASACKAGDLGLIPGFPWGRKWQPTPVFLPGESHGQRSLVGYSPRGRKELDTTERLHFHFHFYLPPE